VGDLILQTREHVQALGWGNRGEDDLLFSLTEAARQDLNLKA
jgi:hypothetical protein